jgi:GAF domain-containing protein
LALFAENALTHEALQREKEGLQKLLEISRTFTPSLDAKKLLIEIANCARSLFKQDYAHLALYDQAADLMRISPLDPFSGDGLIGKETSVSVADCPSGIAVRQGKTLSFRSLELAQIGSDFANRLVAAGVRTLCCFPLVSRNNPIGALCIASKEENAFPATAIELMSQIVPQVAVALDNSRAYAEIASLKDRLVKEKSYLEQEIRDDSTLKRLPARVQHSIRCWNK